MPEVRVTFTAPGSGASGKFSNNTTTAVVNTDDAGVAAAPVFTANIVPGSYTVTATVAGLPGSAAFSLTNNAIYVDPVTGNDTNTCRTPAPACRSIAEALWKANWGDLILLASGTYTGLGPNEAVANIEKSVSFSGQWDSSFLNKNGISVLDAQNSGRGIFVEQNVMTTINRVKIINCQTPDAGYIYGGGVFDRGTLVLEDSNLLNCHAYNQYNNYRYGGGIYNSGSLTLNRVSITGGTAALGGGIYQDGGH